MNVLETRALGLTYGHQAQCYCSGLGGQGWSGSCRHASGCLRTPRSGQGSCFPSRLSCSTGSRAAGKGLSYPGPPGLTSQLALPPLPHRCSRRVCGEKEQAEATP